MKSRAVAFATVAVVGALAGLLYSMNLDPERVEPGSVADSGSESLLGRQRPPFTLGAVDGRQVSVSEFDGEVLLINFWATWCAPCREEMPMLVEVQREFAAQGLKIVGIALDDVEQARAFAADLGITYTNLVGGADVMATAVVYGNHSGMLPYTVLIDREGIVRWTHLGALDREELISRLKALL